MSVLSSSKKTKQTTNWPKSNIEQTGKCVEKGEKNAKACEITSVKGVTD